MADSSLDSLLVGGSAMRQVLTDLKGVIDPKADKTEVDTVKEAIGFNTSYEYVDLGLPSGTLWAKCNVGASSETDYEIEIGRASCRERV